MSSIRVKRRPEGCDIGAVQRDGRIDFFYEGRLVEGCHSNGDRLYPAVGRFRTYVVVKTSGETLVGSDSRGWYPCEVEWIDV